MEHYEEILFQKMKEGTSCFKFIPEDIGEIIYCDSTNPKEEPDSKEQTRKKLILSIAIPLVIAVVDWLLFYTSPIMSSIVSIIMLLIIRYCVKNTLNFNGSNYFVGTEGYAIADFDKTRDNITAKVSYRFEEFTDLITGETRQYRNRVYQCTEYFFKFWDKIENGQKHVVASIESTYDQEKPGDYYEDQRFRFFKNVEDSWSQYRFNKLKETFGKSISTVGFTLYTEKEFYSDYIIFDTTGMQIGNTKYDKNSVKNLRFKNGSLIVEHVNHTSKLFGLIQKGNKEEIPLNMIGNKEIFLRFLQYFVQSFN